MENAKVLSGDAGMQVMYEYYNMLQQPEDLVWSSEFGVRQCDCFPLVMIALADSWRRLVLPFWGLPWKLFGLVSMSSEQGLDFLRCAGMEAGECCKCQDRFFATVSHINCGNMIG